MHSTANERVQPDCARNSDEDGGAEPGYANFWPRAVSPAITRVAVIADATAAKLSNPLKLLIYLVGGADARLAISINRVLSDDGQNSRRSETAYSAAERKRVSRGCTESVQFLTF